MTVNGEAILKALGYIPCGKPEHKCRHLGSLSKLAEDIEEATTATEVGIYKRAMHRICAYCLGLGFEFCFDQCWRD